MNAMYVESMMRHTPPYPIRVVLMMTPIRSFSAVTCFLILFSYLPTIRGSIVPATAQKQERIVYFCSVMITTATTNKVFQTSFYDDSFDLCLLLD